MVVSRKAWRWAVPVGVAAAIGSGVGINGALSASAAPSLPHKSAADLLSGLSTAKVAGMSGTLVERSDLGIPQLPTSLGGDSAELSSLVSGSHTMRVWYDGPQKVRLAVLGTLGESDIIRDSRNVWIWSSDKNTAQHVRLPADDSHVTPRQQPLTPQEMTQQLLKQIDPTTKVTSDGTVSIAGRDAYQLSVAPRDKDSLIGSVRVAIDSQTSLPLRVQVFGKDPGKPAVELGYTRVSFGTPDPSQFTFNPPPGAKVTQAKPEDAVSHHKQPDLTVVGKDWTQVAEVKHVTLPKSGIGAYLQRLPQVSGAWGSGHLFTSNLVSALLTDDNRLYVGAVTPDELYAAAARG